MRLARSCIGCDCVSNPLNWNVFTIDSKEPDRFRNQLTAQEKAAEQGAEVVALTMPTLVGLTMSFGTYSPIHQLLLRL